MLSHIRKSDKAVQSLEAHCRTVSLLCARAASPLGLEKAAELLGLLHDMGKGTAAFRDYLLSACEEDDTPSPHYHAPTGAIFVFRRYFNTNKAFAAGNKAFIQNFTAQLLALCIYGHHGGLLDCLNKDGQSDFLDRINQATAPLHYDEAVKWFCANIADEEELDGLFSKACEEIDAFYTDRIRGKKTFAFYRGMLARLFLSILVDADRWDAACFDRNADSLQEEAAPDWGNLLNTFEAFRQEKLTGDSYINEIRGEISQACYEKAELPRGIFTLCVPTGGGKTYSSLRFALRHAAIHKQQRIFYIIPYNTILDQNAGDIREALGNYSSILEHHSNVVQETETEMENYRLLTERWDSNIVLTSLVQFLNACFSASNTDARRLHRLTNAVLIFDEIQSLPKRCKVLFEWAIQFLTQCCNSTVVLCTATQPKLNLDFEPTELAEDKETLFRSLQRVEYIPELDKIDNNEAASRLSGMAKEASVLAVVNTKAAARDIFEKTANVLRESGMGIAEASIEYDDEEIAFAARNSAENQILRIHLSTSLCPAHRLKLIQWMKIWLKEGKRVLCVSTALIEAGINISFPTVVRSLAGLPNIVQAAGRANRNMEYEKGRVYLWDLREEKLGNLPDIQTGKNISQELLALRSETNPEMPEEIALYFNRESIYTEAEQNYPITEDKESDRRTLTDLLSKNERATRGIDDRKNDKRKLLPLKQSFRCAYKHFRVIEQNTVPILVPFGEGKALIAQLNGDRLSMHEELFLLRKAQAYTVNVYENIYNKLQKEDALYPVGSTGVLALEEGYYDKQMGVSTGRVEVILLEI